MAFSLISSLNDVDESGEFTWTGAKINLYNNLLRALWRGDNIKGSAPIRIKQQGIYGVSINSDAQQTDATYPGKNPLDIIVAPGSVTGTYLFSTYPGTVNGLIPTNMFTSSFGLNQQTVTGITAGTAIYQNINVTTSAQQVTSATITYDTTPAPAIPVQASAPPTTFSYNIGIVISGTQIYRFIAEGSIFFEPTNIYRTNTTNPAPNVVPWLDLWSWVPSIQLNT
jgi:hypothetical protein